MKHPKLNTNDFFHESPPGSNILEELDNLQIQIDKRDRETDVERIVLYALVFALSIIATISTAYAVRIQYLGEADETQAEDSVSTACEAKAR